MLPSRKPADFQATEISLAVLLIGLALGAAWAVFRSPIFEIREIKVSGNDQVSEQDVIVFLQNKILGDSRLNAFWGSRISLVGPGELKNASRRESPRILFCR